MSLALFPVFVVGLLGSVHCVGMCGGIVGAFSAVPTVRRAPFPVPVTAQGALGVAPAAAPAAAAQVARVLAYNSGRIGSYMAAGAIAGGLAGGVRTLAGAAPLQAGAYALANLMLVVLGLYLMDAWRGLAMLEGAGAHLWRRLRPLGAALQPLDSPAKMLALGAVWGWLPCGMVYSVLVTALMSGSAASGAAVMLAFGLGTLPMLLALGLAGARLRGALQRPGVRRGAGLVVLAFGLLGLLRAAGVGGAAPHWLDILCLPGAAL